jgi:methylated-DNA-[protein]-cysteine S-methyltransferase
MDKRLNSDIHLSYTILETAAGWIGLLASPQGCLRASFPQKTREMAGIALGQNACQAMYSPDSFGDWGIEFSAYFRGEKVNFSGKIDLSRATPFEQAVWKATQNIPYGETRSYSWIARKIEKPRAPRAVGQALGRNPMPVIIPCHRILASDGSLGGFGGGLEMKQFLLSLESSK